MMIATKNVFTHLAREMNLHVIAGSLTTIFLMVIGCSEHMKSEPPPAKFPMKHVTVEGINIGYFEKGQGEPLVFVHGIPTSSFLWRNMIDELSAHNRIIAPDLPGFGFSDPPPNGNYSISNYARILNSFLETLAIEQTTLVCHDFGGPVTLTYALRHPDKYHRLIIFDTFLHTELPPWPLYMKILKTRPIGEIIMRIGGKSLTRSGLKEGVTDKSRISEEIFQHYYMPDGKPDKLNKTMLETLRIDYKEDLEFIEKNLGTIDKPTLIVWGEKDKFLPISLGDRIHKDILGSKMVKIPNCGHFVQEDQPEHVTKIILAFLKKSGTRDLGHILK